MGAVKALKAGFFNADVLTVTDSNENGSEVSFLFSLIGKTLGTKMHVQTGKGRRRRKRRRMYNLIKKIEKARPGSLAAKCF